MKALELGSDELPTWSSVQLFSRYDMTVLLICKSVLSKKAHVLIDVYCYKYSVMRLTDTTESLSFL